MWFWLVVALLAGVGEVLTTGLFLAIVAVAAIVTALIALVLPFTLVQIALFAGMSPASAVPLLLALADAVPPTYLEVAPGIGVNILPTVLPDGSSARLCGACWHGM